MACMLLPKGQVEEELRQITTAVDGDISDLNMIQTSDISV